MATTNCSTNLYTINFTDPTKDAIYVSKGELITDRADIAFVGKTKRDYGEIFNENVLHLLEHFACPEDATNIGNPDLASAFGALLERPLEGQIWYNTTQKRPFRYDGVAWGPLGTGCDVAGNYGVIAHGESLPQPVCATTGYVFQYSECTWIVSPFYYSADINYMRCSTDEYAVVTMEYRPVGEAIATGLVNYQIVGIKDNNNAGSIGPVPSLPAPSSSQTPTPTPTPTDGLPPTPNPTVTPEITLTPEITPTESVDPTGDVIAGIYQCLKIDTTTCLYLNSSGYVSGAGCGLSGGTDWVNGFRSGEDGSDYTFTVTYATVTPAVSGPLSGDLGTTKSWCLPPPTTEIGWQNEVYIEITGPKGDIQTVTLTLIVDTA